MRLITERTSYPKGRNIMQWFYPILAVAVAVIGVTFMGFALTCQVIASWRRHRVIRKLERMFDEYR